jgi:hypothetical protein
MKEADFVRRIDSEYEGIPSMVSRQTQPPES